MTSRKRSMSSSAAPAAAGCRPLFTFTVRTTPETAWEVVRTFGNEPDDSTEVVFRGDSEYQAHAVARALAYYSQHDRPAEPMRERYEVTLPRLAGKAREPAATAAPPAANRREILTLRATAAVADLQLRPGDLLIVERKLGTAGEFSMLRELPVDRQAALDAISAGELEILTPGRENEVEHFLPAPRRRRGYGRLALVDGGRA